MTARPQVVALAAAVGTVLAVGPALAYGGGPLRVEMDGCESREAKVFFRLLEYNATGAPPQVHYFDLDGGHPERAQRAYSLEQDSTEIWDCRGMPPAWRRLAGRLVPLPFEDRFDLDVRATSAPIGPVGREGAPGFLVTVEFTAGDLRGRALVEAACRPMVAVRGLYGIPGRPERLVVLTYIGRAYGCEEVDLPVLLR